MTAPCISFSSTRPPDQETVSEDVLEALSRGRHADRVPPAEVMSGSTETGRTVVPSLASSTSLGPARPRAGGAEANPDYARRRLEGVPSDSSCGTSCGIHGSASDMLCALWRATPTPGGESIRHAMGERDSTSMCTELGRHHAISRLPSRARRWTLGPRHQSRSLPTGGGRLRSPAQSASCRSRCWWYP